jgi:hypothetical protein
MMGISNVLNSSIYKVIYWMQQHSIEKRSIAEAVYQHNNPNGDPFKIAPLNTMEKAELYGLGIGLYWRRGKGK